MLRKFPKDLPSTSAGGIPCYCRQCAALTVCQFRFLKLGAVSKDLEKGRLSVLPIEEVPPDGLILPMSVVWQTKSPPGPAGRWFIERLKQIPVSVGKMPKPAVRRKKRNGRR